MFDFVRKHNRIFQFFLVLLILPSFVFFGIQGYSRFASDQGVIAKVGKQRIMQQEYDNAHRTAVERIRAQQPDADIAAIDTPALKRQTLDMLVRKYVLGEAANDQRIKAAPGRLVRYFMSDPQFAALRNPDGSPNKALLEARGMSLPQFEALLNQELTFGQVLVGVAATGQTSKAANRGTVDALFQVREVQLQKFEAKQYVAQINPTPEQLQAFYKDPANDAWLMAPEHADVEVVALDVEWLKDKVQISKDDLERAYKENLAKYTPPEERRASHILIKAEPSAKADVRKAARAKAEALLAQVQKNPAQFAEIAKKNSEDTSAANGGDLDFFTRGAMVKPFEDAVFGMKTGQVSGIVETDFGFHIIQVTGVRGGQPRPFEEVRPQIEAEARKQVAQRDYAGVAEKFTNIVYEQSDSLKPVADELKLSVMTVNNVQRDPAANQELGVFSNRRLIEALFDPNNRAKARNTEAIEVGPNKLVSARIVKYYPAARKPFEQVQAQVKERFIQAEALKAARRDAEAKVELWKQSPDKAQLPPAIQLSRKLALTQAPQLLEGVLRQPVTQLPAWVTIDLGAEGVAVARINKVSPAEVTPRELAETELQFGNYWGMAESDAYYRALKREYKVEFVNEGKKIMEGAVDAQKSASAS